MTPSQQLARARNCVKQCFNDRQIVPDGTDDGIPKRSNVEFRESIFVCGGFYRGRRFRSEDLSAVWFAEEDEVKVHTNGGEFVASYNVEEMNRMLDPVAASVLSMHSAVVGSPQAEAVNYEQPIRRAA